MRSRGLNGVLLFLLLLILVLFFTGRARSEQLVTDEWVSVQVHTYCAPQYTPSRPAISRVVREAPRRHLRKAQFDHTGQWAQLKPQIRNKAEAIIKNGRVGCS